MIATIIMGAAVADLICFALISMHSNWLLPIDWSKCLRLFASFAAVGGLIGAVFA